jgi:hypothetical protein
LYAVLAKYLVFTEGALTNEGAAEMAVEQLDYLCGLSMLGESTVTMGCELCPLVWHIGIVTESAAD